ncbi:hypothetical protein [Pontixanthobacter sp. CEM42]|uniref:hypothetical protein n=1 Tax=Pontixanthobacter sp. CEM42 TaxID=2792077 RepID=UPI001AE02621|nr:hypothetical protein [Pontixanthobacter sp. CEM42]
MLSRRRKFLPCLAILAIAMPHPVIAQEIDFGDDSSRYANDGECDDSRFSGSGMTSTVLLDSDIGADASDCSAAYERGDLTFLANIPRLSVEEIKWGDDSGEWANDSECDDVRFVGPAMADALLVDGVGKDASDCRAAYSAKSISLNPFFNAPADDKKIIFGDDTSAFAKDGRCDDIRFTGDYASETIYLVDDIGHDATDCKSAFESGEAIWQANDLPIKLGELPDEDAS